MSTADVEKDLPTEQEVTEAIGRNLRAWRKLRSVTQAELARRVGLATSTIANLEAGRRSSSATVLVKLALALDTHPAALCVLPLPGLTLHDALGALAVTP